jgi:peptidyl-prolyl cis-trans isomerase D
MGVFQQGGRFDSQLYQRMLAANRMTPEMFEESLREDLMAEKLRGVITSGAKVSDSEVYETFAWREGKVRIDYIHFEPDTNQAMDITSEEMQAFFSENAKSYEFPPKVKAGYVVFSSEALEPQITVTEEEITQYFDLNKERYGTPKKVKARHILFKLDAGANEEKRQAVRQKAQKILAEARSGADFAALAKKYSEDPGSKSNGGDLGFFTRERMVKPFSDAAFSLAPGEISEPVATDFGWHIIKTEAVQEGKDAVLEEVKEDIRKQLIKEGAKNLAYDKADALYSDTYGGLRLGEAAMAAGLKMTETDFFSQGDLLKQVKQSAKFSQTAFALGDEEVSEPLDFGDGYYVIQVIDRQAAAIPELEDVEEKVRKDLLKRKQDDAVKKKAEALLAAASEGKDLQREAKALGVEMKSTDPFKRFGSIPGIGFEQELSEAAFSLGPSRPLPEKVIKGKKGYYVIRFKEELAADVAGFEAKKSEIRSGLLVQKRQNLLQDWFDQLRREGDILIEEGFLN